MAIDSDKVAPPPYISFRTFLNVLDKLRQGGLPQYLDRHYWGGFLSGSVGPQVVSTFRYLGLVAGEHNEPTDILERITQAEDPKEQLGGLLRSRYGPIFESVDLERATHGQIDAEFGRQFNLSGATRRKAVTFFLHAVEYTGIPLSKHVQVRPRRQPQRSPAKNGRPPRNTEPKIPNEAAQRKIHAPFPTSSAVTTKTKTVEFKRGGSISMTYDADLFDMDKADRDFLLELIDMLSRYQERSGDDEEVAN